MSSGSKGIFNDILNNFAVLLYQNARQPLRNSFNKSKAVLPV